MALKDLDSDGPTKPPLSPETLYREHDLSALQIHEERLMVISLRMHAMEVKGTQN